MPAHMVGDLFREFRGLRSNKRDYSQWINSTPLAGKFGAAIPHEAIQNMGGLLLQVRPLRPASRPGDLET